jgi:hypothetical protein
MNGRVSGWMGRLWVGGWINSRVEWVDGLMEG